jgi:hypothetical protein
VDAQQGWLHDAGVTQAPVLTQSALKGSRKGSESVITVKRCIADCLVGFCLILLPHGIMVWNCCSQLLGCCGVDFVTAVDS